MFTDLSSDSQSGEILVHSGVDIMNVSAFLKKMCNETAGPNIDVPYPCMY